MAKRSTKKQAFGWTASKITESDLAKAKEEGNLYMTKILEATSNQLSSKSLGAP
jgi:hypothetical protein